MTGGLKVQLSQFYTIVDWNDVSIGKIIKLSRWFWKKSRSSYQTCSIIKGVLRNFAKFTGKQLFQGLFLHKVACLRPPVFSCEFCKISKNIFFTEHLRTTAPKNHGQNLLTARSASIRKTTFAYACNQRYP